MYISCCFFAIFRVGYAKISRRKGSFQWNMGFRVTEGNNTVRKYNITLYEEGPGGGGATWFKLCPDVCPKVKYMGPFSASRE